MSMAEARRQYPSVHIYWHGPGHCWDSTAAQRHRIHRVERGGPIREVQQKTDQLNTDQPATDQSKWRDAMSAMISGDGPVKWLGVSRDASQEGNDDAAAGAPWTDRWVDIEQSPVVARWVDIPQVTAPPIVESKTVLSITPGGVVLVCIVFWLALGTMMVLFGGTIHQWRSRRR
jgi:hypothetical protein